MEHSDINVVHIKTRQTLFGNTLLPNSMARIGDPTQMGS